MKYRKKPVVIEAVRWMMLGDHPAVSSHNDCFSSVRHEICPQCNRDFDWHGVVRTLEDGHLGGGHGVSHVVCPGDFIITGVKGENYACKPDIFEATYEPADGPSEFDQLRSRNAELERQLAELAKTASSNFEYAVKWQERAEKAEARIAESQRQNPVGYGLNGEHGWSYAHSKFAESYVPLYAAPVVMFTHEEKERAIYSLYIQGKRQKVIANIFCMTPNSIKCLIQRYRKKHGIKEKYRRAYS